MEGAPPGIDVATLERITRGTPGVRDVHDLHVWSIVDDAPVVTAHVVLEPGAMGSRWPGTSADESKRRSGGAHVTVQPEAASPEERLFPTDTLVRRG